MFLSLVHHGYPYERVILAAKMGIKRAEHGSGPRGRRLDKTGFIQEGELEIRIDHESGAEVLSLYGELDHSNAHVLESTLLGAESRETEAIILDLSGLEFCDSTGLGVIIRAATRSSQDSDRLAMLRARDQVQRLLKISGLEEHLPFID